MNWCKRIFNEHLCFAFSKSNRIFFIMHKIFINHSSLCVDEIEDEVGENSA